MDRTQDWLAQAEYDLETAKQLIAAKSYAWSCFIAQQSAEKSLRAVLEHLGRFRWSHDLIDLLGSLEQEISIPSNFEKACHRLNPYYVSTRYPDAFTSGAPSAKFSKTQSLLACSDAKVVMDFAREVINR